MISDNQDWGFTLCQSTVNGRHTYLLQNLIDRCLYGTFRHVQVHANSNGRKESSYTSISNWGLLNQVKTARS